MKFENEINIKINLNKKAGDLEDYEIDILKEYLGIYQFGISFDGTALSFYEDGDIELFINNNDNVLETLNGNEIKLVDYDPRFGYHWGKLEKFKPKTYNFGGRMLTKKQILEELGE